MNNKPLMERLLEAGYPPEDIFVPAHIESI